MNNVKKMPSHSDKAISISKQLVRWGRVLHNPNEKDFTEDEIVNMYAAKIDDLIAPQLDRVFTIGKYKFQLISEVTIWIEDEQGEGMQITIKEFERWISFMFQEKM